MKAKLRGLTRSSQDKAEEGQCEVKFFCGGKNLLYFSRVKVYGKSGHAQDQSDVPYSVI